MYSNTKGFSRFPIPVMYPYTEGFGRAPKSIDGIEEASRVIKNAGQEMRTLLIERMKSMFGDKFPQLKYVAFHGVKWVTIMTEGIDCSDVTFEYDEKFNPAHNILDSKRLILLPDGLYVFDIERIDKDRVLYPVLGNEEETEEAKPLLYCLFGQGILRMLRNDLKKKKTKKRVTKTKK